MSEEFPYPAQFKIGAMYRVPWSPNPHRLERIEKQHCQLHGEHIGWRLGLRKRRNSEKRQWGCALHMASADMDIQPWEEPAQ